MLCTLEDVYSTVNPTERLKEKKGYRKKRAHESHNDSAHRKIQRYIRKCAHKPQIESYVNVLLKRFAQYIYHGSQSESRQSTKKISRRHGCWPATIAITHALPEETPLSDCPPQQSPSRPVKTTDTR